MVLTGQVRPGDIDDSRSDARLAFASFVDAATASTVRVLINAGSPDLHLGEMIGHHKATLNPSKMSQSGHGKTGRL